jgi:hypothetical protein
MRLVVGLRPSGIEPLTCRGMLTEVSGSRLQSTERMKQTFVDRMESLRSDYLNDDQFRAAVNKVIKLPGQPRATPIVLRELVGGLMRDSKSPIKPNDAMDFFHAVVPVSYCDVVLLDGRWRDQVDRLRDRFVKLGLEVPVAKAFSGSGAFEALLKEVG